jgi:hypothetical protein
MGLPKLLLLVSLAPMVGVKIGSSEEELMLTQPGSIIFLQAINNHDVLSKYCGTGHIIGLTVFMPEIAIASCISNKAT